MKKNIMPRPGLSRHQGAQSVTIALIAVWGLLNPQLSGT